VGLKELMANFGGGKRGRKLHQVEIWQKRNAEKMAEALKETDYDELMGSSDDEETADEWKARIKAGLSTKLALRRRVANEQYSLASVEERAAVAEIYEKQERKKTGLDIGKAETPEEFQL
jgi:hypothetical protein